MPWIIGSTVSCNINSAFKSIPQRVAEKKRVSISGLFTGEEKAELVTRMEEISHRISQGTAQIDFSYDTGSVIAKISAKINQEMKLRAATKAHIVATKGLTGLIARVVMLWNGLGKDAQRKLISGLEAGYINDEKTQTTAQMAQAFSLIISQTQHHNQPSEQQKINSIDMNPL